ncbi:MAG: hypothetical protein LBL95_02670 [Deltaproteobacteria bacterium]|jgi:hypothetical protein|nr:hypothetical protein [Deltaproteobacteria bacterium]
MKTLNIIRLSPEHLQELTEVVNSGPRRSRRVIMAMALIWLDCAQNGPARPDSYVCDALGLSPLALDELKELYLRGGPGLAVNHCPNGLRKAPGQGYRIDLGFEDKLIALANSEAPHGRPRWSVRLLAEKAIELNLIQSISHMTVHRLLKKHNLNLAANGED